MITAIKERPVLFAGDMVRAIESGTKTQTRRVIKHREDRWEVMDNGMGGPLWPCWPCYVYGEPEPIDMPCPYGRPGDRLWVRENFSVSTETIGLGGSLRGYDATKHSGLRVWYQSDNNRPTWAESRWRPSIHMPRWACRIVLEVTDVRVEQLNEISNTDAIAEGIQRYRDDCYKIYTETTSFGTSSPIKSFASLWDSINGAGAWEANPWVWAVSFKRVE